MSQDFWLGFFIGFFVASVIGWFFWTMYKYNRPANAYTRPQMVMNPTSKTPQQVYRDAVSAQIRILILRLLLVVYVIGVAAVLSEEVRALVLSFVRAMMNTVQ